MELRKEHALSPSPLPRKCEKCKKVLPAQRTDPAHAMCGLCTVTLDNEHFTESYKKVKCSACRALSSSSYSDYKKKAAFLASISAIKQHDADLLEEVEDAHQGSGQDYELSDAEIELGSEVNTNNPP